MKRQTILFLLMSLLLGAAALPIMAQTPEPTPAPAVPDEGVLPIPQVHTVQDGENLTYIAETYGVTVAELLQLNGLTEDDLLYVGQTLIVPGGEGEAVATVHTAQAGDTVAGVAAAFNTTTEAVLRTNRLIHTHFELVAGRPLTVISRTGSALPQPVTGTPHVVGVGESLVMVAARYGLTPAALAQANDLPFPTVLFPGQRLRIPSEAAYRTLPGEWVDVQVEPLPVMQGDTVVIRVRNLLDGRPSGQFAGQPLRFFPFEDGFAALVGIDAFTEPGAGMLRLEGSGSRPWRPFQQPVLIQDAGYGTQQINVGPELSDLLVPEVRQNEDAFLSTIYGQFNETQYWEGIFQTPVTTTVVTAGYGDGRSYNGGPVEIYHTGIDFAGTIGTPIYVPANGVVMLADNLELRGQTVVIDHGLGVMTAYFHLSEMFVAAGETVTAGQLLGSGGSTGLSTGPHLHWDVRIMDVPVDGTQWLERAFP